MPSQFSSKKLLFVCLFVAFSSPFLSSCELTDNYLKHDRENNMQEQDYRDSLAPRQTELDDVNDGRMAGGIPSLQPYVAQPDTNYKPMPLVSISVNQSVPLRDIIYEIAEQAQYDVELDPRIRGSIIFSARNRPLDMVIDRISEIAGLRYKFSDDMLRVELDTPYHEIYKVNYLALTRTNASSISNNISVVQGEGADTGSAFSASNESVIDFWTELETNLTQITTSNRDSNRLATSLDPQVTLAESNPEQIPQIGMDENGNILTQAPDVNIDIQQLPVDPAAEAPVDPNDEDPFAARFSLNRQAGLVSVFAPERVHKKVAVYMKELKKSVSSQVLIEAKVLEVSLNDRFAAGIDWSQVDIKLFGGNGALGFGPTAVGTGLVRGIIDPSGAPEYNAGAIYSKDDFSAAVAALARFGTVQALASPRLTVLNNQSAALNVAENVVFFEVTNETVPGQDGNPDRQTITSEARSVPEGVLINVQPSIDNDTQLVSMAIRPTITTVTTSVEDPANPGNFVPQVNVQEFDSIIQMSNGQAVVLGGLIQDRTTSTRNSVPVLGEIPVFGAAFRNQQDEIAKTELVVFLKATIIEGGNSVHTTDKDLYRSFSDDRRPLKF